MPTRIHHLIIAAAAALLTTVSTYAQQQLRQITDELVESDKCEVIYSEKRNPETHNLVSSSYTITSKDKVMYNRIAAAIKADRKNSVNYSQIGNDMYSITFEEDGNTIGFTLINDDDEWLFTVNEQPTRRKKQKSEPRTSTSPAITGSDTDA